ncbi:MAG: CBS domain-containing protein, partial [Spirochaetia bacterium]|nr:CBS domain-containing protein [Spirochaetia bacterium]
MSKLKVRDIMTTQVISLRGEDTVREATVRFAIDGVSGAPVVNDSGDLIGILSETDVLELVMSYQDKLHLTNPSLYLLALPFDESIDDPEIQEASLAISNTKVK